MPTYTHLAWERGPSGWELWAVDSTVPMEDRIELLAWVFELHAKKKWSAIVYQPEGFDNMRDFDILEDAQAWCVACVRMS